MGQVSDDGLRLMDQFGHTPGADAQLPSGITEMDERGFAIRSQAIETVRGSFRLVHLVLRVLRFR